MLSSNERIQNGAELVAAKPSKEEKHAETSQSWTWQVNGWSTGRDHSISKLPKLWEAERSVRVQLAFCTAWVDWKMEEQVMR